MNYILRLNPMTANTERMVDIAWGTLPALQAYIDSERAPEPYQEGNWYKVFKKAGVLEWYNAPNRFGSGDKFKLDPATQDKHWPPLLMLPSREEAMMETGRHWDQFTSGLLHAGG